MCQITSEGFLPRIQAESRFCSADRRLHGVVSTGAGSVALLNSGGTSAHLALYPVTCLTIILLLLRPTRKESSRRTLTVQTLVENSLGRGVPTIHNPSHSLATWLTRQQQKESLIQNRYCQHSSCHRFTERGKAMPSLVRHPFSFAGILVASSVGCGLVVVAAQLAGWLTGRQGVVWCLTWRAGTPPPPHHPPPPPTTHHLPT